MAVLEIVQIGHPALRERARELTRQELGNSRWQSFIDDLIETMYAANGAGLAANQVNEPVRVCVVEVRPDHPRYPEKEPIPLTVLVNPVLTPLGTEMLESYEGCLSVPNLRGKVARYATLKVEYLDRHASECVLEIRGIKAVTFQHECDHLNGKLFIDRVTDPSSLTTWENYAAYHRD
jgi:peptide deformylase